MPNEEFEKGRESRQPEIDALKFDRTVLRSLFSNASREIERLRKENATLNAEVEKLRAEKLQLAYKLNAAQSNLFALQQGQYEMPDAAMKEMK